MIYDIPVEESVLNDFLSTYDTYRYDPIDFIVAESCLQEGVHDIITDDQDFQSDQRFDIYVV